MDEKLKNEIKKLVESELREKLEELGVKDVVVADKLPPDSGENQWIIASPLGCVANFIVYCVRTVHKTVKVIAVPLTYLSVLTFSGNLLVPGSIPTTKELAIIINKAMNNKENVFEFQFKPGPYTSTQLYAYHDSNLTNQKQIFSDDELKKFSLISPRRIGKTSVLKMALINSKLNLV